jgi:hypothetical protein
MRHINEGRNARPALEDSMDYVDQNEHRPEYEKSARTYLDRLARWSKAGRCKPLKVGKKRLLPRDVYERLLWEDSAGQVSEGEDSELAKLGYAVGGK